MSEKNSINLLQNENGALPENGKLNGVPPSPSGTDQPDPRQTQSQPGFKDRIAARWRLDRSKLVVQSLLVLALVATLFVLVILIFDGKMLAQRFRLPEAIAAPAAPDNKVSNKPEKSILTVFDRRSYFIREQARPLSQAVSGPVDAAELPAFSSKFALLGILMGDTPQAIVKENSSNTTVFLTRGQSLAGYEVKDILPDRVVLQRDGELVNLRM